jgi:hypothetical protein
MNARSSSHNKLGCGRRGYSAAPATSQNGAALLIVLAFVVLLTVLSVAFFSRAAVDRQVSFSSSNQTKADLLARGALAVTVGDLKQEIGAGSTASTVSGVTIYSPNAATTTTPALAGSTGTAGLENLVKRSANGIRFYPNNANYDAAASNRAAGPSTSSASTVPSLNGRSVSLARWNKPFLLQKATLTSDTDAAPVGTFVPPDWILVARDGSNPKTWASNMRTSPTNVTSVIGRYAYAIYDEGGLLDLNVAGHPTANTVVQVGRKGSSAFADLTQIPGISNLTTGATGSQTKFLNDIVGWRNYSSAAASGTLGTFATGNAYTFASGDTFFSSVGSNTNGFLLVSNTTLRNNQSDRMFLSRQQLMSLLLRGLASTPSDRANLQVALEYLGTFSREYNRPSWKPATVSAINPDLSTLRVTQPFNRIDQETAVTGEPLLKNRFPLRRLSWLTYAGPSASRTFPPASPALPATDPNYDMWQLLYTYGIPQSYLQQGTAANIKNAFGLVWDTRSYVAAPRAGQQWVYTSPSSAHSGGTFDGTSGSSAIVLKTLATVQTEGREADFFEILKTVILNGSVGLGSDTTANTFVAPEPKYYDITNGKSADYEIVQIGANVIDAWDIDNIPTWISFNGNEPTGVENIPYLNKLVFCPDFPSNSGSNFDAWLVPSLWNPHRNAPGIGTIRIALTGTGVNTAYATGKSPNATIQSPPIALPSSMDLDASAFGTTPSAPMAASNIVGMVTNTGSPERFFGFHYPFPPTANQVTQANAESAYPDFEPGSGATNVVMQIQIPGTTTFIPYETWTIAAVGSPLQCTSVKKNNNFANSPKLQDPEFVSLDPRTLRFGIWGTAADQQQGGGGGNGKKDYSQGANDSMDQVPPANRIEQITQYQPQGASFIVGNQKNLSQLSANNQAGTYYKDLDGVQRRADITTNDGISGGNTIMYPIAPGLNDRAMLPSAPFQSVAELGQVFRDQPWKTLGFTISNSADAGLLDVFTLQDVSTTGIAQSPSYLWITAGRTSLNTRQAPVLTAIISQVTKTISGTGIIPIDSTDTTVSDLATAITGLATMGSKAEVVAKLATNGTFIGLGNKEARECVIRALCDSTQTRTWNLMIDVIAQSGKYPPTAQGLADFVVEGEKRYWLHIAIDRFTGEVIDQQLEAVDE